MHTKKTFVHFNKTSDETFTIFHIIYQDQYFHIWIALCTYYIQCVLNMLKCHSKWYCEMYGYFPHLIRLFQFNSASPPMMDFSYNNVHVFDGINKFIVLNFSKNIFNVGFIFVVCACARFLLGLWRNKVYEIIIIRPGFNKDFTADIQNDLFT